jgi:hypothetical protein
VRREFNEPRWVERIGTHEDTDKRAAKAVRRRSVRMMARGGDCGMLWR